LLAGQVQLYFVTTPVSIGYLKSGRLRALAVTTAERAIELPDVPTIGEFVPGYEASAWYGVGAPRDTPEQIVGKLNWQINAAITEPNIKARLNQLGCTLMTGSPADFAKLIANETVKWGEVVKFAGIKLE
jgi:tripartite-type tricarboxylate transporter receptor subunit TctC